MVENKSQLINITQLLTLQEEDLVLIDARSGTDVKDKYLEQHLKGALFVDLNEDLSDIKADFANGGRHPLPSTKQFSKLLTQLGITPQSRVVVYDDKNGANAAARFWWMLKAIGHEQVQVLDGGLTELISEQVPMSSEIEKARVVPPYPVTSWQLPISDIDQVERISKNTDYLVIDVRTPKRYAGEIEPIDLIAGHIPGAINIPFSSNLDEEGNFLSKAELKGKYQAIIGDRKMENVIIHCGSGVTACHSILAIAQAELPIPKLYVGSWSEWSRNDKEMITKSDTIS
ncbi:MAG: sulfurtransferase [Bacteroidota bacterium]